MGSWFRSIRDFFSAKTPATGAADAAAGPVDQNVAPTAEKDACRPDAMQVTLHVPGMY